VTAVAALIEALRERSGGESFLDRLDDVRGRLIGSLVVVTLATGIGFYLAITTDILGIFTAPVQPFLGGGKLKYLSPVDPFFITLKLAIYTGLLLAFPYLLAQIWGVLSPLMRPEEKRLAGPAIIGAVVLFAVGSVFCYFLVIPLMLQFTMGFQTDTLEQSLVIGEYLSVVLRLLMAFGVAFELPIVIVLLTALGVVTPDFLAARRRHAIAVLTIASAVMTPPDVSSQVLLIVPVYLLFEISIVLSRGIVSRRTAAVGAENTSVTI
jgi:sec-independent protein translocase protein TatC